MNPYIQQLKTELEQFTDSGDFSVSELLWYCYSASNPIDDGLIKQRELALQPVFEELSNDSADKLFDLVTDLCFAYQRAAFMEGMNVGIRIQSELGI